jgi:toxin ParE1/3/4
MRLRWTPDAASDLENIAQRIDQNSPETARKVIRTIFDGIELLIKFPHRGRRGALGGTRELVLSPLPYIAVYRIEDQQVEILHVYHGAQDWM